MNTQTLSDLSKRLLTLSTGQQGLRTQLPVQVSVPGDTAEPVIDIRVSDETLDRYGEIISAAGWRLDNYRQNPVIQNAHQYGDVIFTIGKAIRTEVAGSELIQRWQFAVEANPFARIAYGLYRGGFLNTASVGFIPIRWENGNEQTAWRRKYLEQELLEVSAVGIPANPNALMLALKAGAVQARRPRTVARVPGPRGGRCDEAHFPDRGCPHPQQCATGPPCGTFRSGLRCKSHTPCAVVACCG